MASKSKPKPADNHDVDPPSKQSLGLPAQPGLWLVSTPIGNARDITLRALDALKAADIIACEDTRVTKKLLAIHGISALKLLAYHDHNAAQAAPKIIEALIRGQNVALVSDAGTPMINDPGFRLIGQVLERGLNVTSLPGASAVLTALQLSGQPTDRFLYLGFPPNKSKARLSFYQEVEPVAATLVFLESPKRLVKSLADMTEVFGDRTAAVTRELTKTFEEVRRGLLAELTEHYTEAGPAERGSHDCCFPAGGSGIGSLVG